MLTVAWAWFLINWHWLWILGILLGIIAIVCLTTGSKYWDGFLDALIIDSWFGW
jgi:hypothetical protein